MADYPQDLKYTVEHEWVRRGDPGRTGDTTEGGLVVRVGITGYAQDALGDIVFVSLPAPGTAVSAGDALGEVESTKSVSTSTRRWPARSSRATKISTAPQS